MNPLNRRGGYNPISVYVLCMCGRGCGCGCGRGCGCGCDAAVIALRVKALNSLLLCSAINKIDII